jgi:DNA-binding NarL/FixJ family response regulator
MHILLVDDHALFREGLGLLLRDLNAQIEVHHAGTVEAALQVASGCPLALVLLDLSLPGRSGFEALEELRRRRDDLPVVVMSSADDRATVMAAIEAGAMGFVPKTSSSAVMIGALRIVLAGGIYLPPESFLGDGGGAQAPRPEQQASVTPAELGLTPRQTEVLRLVLEGQSIKRIARALNASENTIKTHVSAVLRALNVTTRTQAVVAANRMSLRFSST